MQTSLTTRLPINCPPFCPPAIVNVTDGVPVLAQWNYRILCHPLQGDLLELHHLQPTDDVHSRLPPGETLDEWLASRRGRYHVTDAQGDRPAYGGEL